MTQHALIPNSNENELQKNKQGTFFHGKADSNQSENEHDNPGIGMNVRKHGINTLGSNLFFKPAASVIQRKCAACEEEQKHAGRANGLEYIHGTQQKNLNIVSAKTVLQPHESSHAMQQQEAKIYAENKTPLRIGNEVVSWDAKPLDAKATGAHLNEIQRSYGDAGVNKSMHGLEKTRGEIFAKSAMQHAGFSAANHEGGNVSKQTTDIIHASKSSSTLPGQVVEKLAGSAEYNFGNISIHNDESAHAAANQLSARAFTIGNDIYFGNNEYNPASAEGVKLIAHEAAHAVQQQGRKPSAGEQLSTTSANAATEHEADEFADHVLASATNNEPLLSNSNNTGLVHRAISFTHANNRFTTNAMVAAETATGFSLASNPVPAFQWDSDVTIHGVAGDPFANFEVGFLQVEREFYTNVHWGSGANHTHMAIRPDHLPRRDATAEANTWYDDGGPSLAAAFTANGDVRSPSFDDTPGTAEIPWTNPVAGRAGNSGWFNYGDAFVTYLSARDTTVGTGANAFRDIACVYWNLSSGGTFDAAQPLNNRVRFTGPHAPRRSGVIQGGSAEFPAMHGGTIANGHDVETTT